MCYYIAIDGWYNYTPCHLAKWLCNSNEFLFKHLVVSARSAGEGAEGSSDVNGKGSKTCTYRTQVKRGEINTGV